MELDELFAGFAVMTDGSTQIKSGTLKECAEWADEIMKSEDIKEIDIRRIENRERSVK